MKTIITFLVALTFSLVAISQNYKKEFELIQLTGIVVHSAHKAALSNKISSENLSKCIEHQRYAVTLFKNNAVEMAAYHSAYARRLAFEILKANNSSVNPHYQFTNIELEFLKGSPSNDELNSKITNKLQDNKNYLIEELHSIDLFLTVF